MALLDSFDFPVAYDPASDELVAGATFTVHAVDDLAFATPLAVIDPVSGAAISPLVSSTIGVLPSFRVAGDPSQVILKSGSFATLLTSRYGALAEAGFDPEEISAAVAAVPAAQAARDAAIAAKNAAEAVPTTTDGLMSAVQGNPASAFAIAQRASFAGVVGAPLASGPAWTRKGVKVTLANVTTPFDSIYWPWVVKVKGVGTPLGDYYLYYSTDHQNGRGGIGLMYGPTPSGPWTNHGLVYQDTVAGRQTETPAVIYAPDLDAVKPFFMYYQQDWVDHPSGSINIPAGVVGAQSTLLAQSADGITWTRYDRLGDGSAASGVVLDAYSGSSQTGNAHSGYFSPMRVGRSIAGPSLFGGGDYPGFAYWVSTDGKLFERSQRKLGYNTDLTMKNLGGRLTSWNHSMVFEYRGELWWIGVVTNFSSGGDAKNARICQARIAADRMTLLSEPEVVIDGAGTGESVNIRAMSIYVEGSTAYLWYQCDNNFLLATCGGI